MSQPWCQVKRPEIRAQIGEAAGEKMTASSALFLELKDMEVESVLATNSVLVWAKNCWNQNEGRMGTSMEVDNGLASQLEGLQRTRKLCLITAGRSRKEVAKI